MGREGIVTIIMGAAGRDFHNFNVCFRDNPDYRVVAFTATQIPNIEGRRYPAGLAGHLYPQGIPIYPEEKLPALIRQHGVQQVVFAYSDVSHEHVMHKASLVVAAGADFRLMGTGSTMLKSKKTGGERVRRAYRRGQEPDHPSRLRHIAENGSPRGRGAPSYALWRSGGTGCAAVCQL